MHLMADIRTRLNYKFRSEALWNWKSVFVFDSISLPFLPSVCPNHKPIKPIISHWFNTSIDVRFLQS